MSSWEMKRFWQDATVQQADGGFAVLLDGRAVKTPAKAALVLPTAALAEAVACEWRAVEEKIEPNLMPYTRSANAAIDKVGEQFDEVAELIAAYADSDLLCYRADSPAELRARQDAAWDALLQWVEREHGLKLDAHSGVMHKAQALQMQELALHLTCELSSFQLTAFHDLVSMSGSFVIGLAAVEGWQSPEGLWEISRIDELWQEELWGKDEEATQTAAIKEAAFIHAAKFYRLTTDG